LSDNFANLGGGGIYNSGGTVTISNSTFSRNHCWEYREPCYGGGIWNEGILNISSSTF